MRKKMPPKPAGRPVEDQHGNRVWKWSQTGGDIDTQTVRALGEDLTLDAADKGASASGSDPYNQAGTAPPDTKASRRRTLDDMRELSEHIKTSKHWTRDD